MSIRWCRWAGSTARRSPCSGSGEHDLQISLPTEHELAKRATLLGDIASDLGVQTQVEDELEEVNQDAAPAAALDEIERRGRQA
jgi:uncharacterized membrane protein